MMKRDSIKKLTFALFVLILVAVFNNGSQYLFHLVSPYITLPSLNILDAQLDSADVLKTICYLVISAASVAVIFLATEISFQNEKNVEETSWIKGFKHE